ncbi:MAG TPA: 4Fe-4S binding protein [Pirellulaceae bacterium]|nr:4Fe-4S binding protein [Pirellulaceae bacterium]
MAAVPDKPSRREWLRGGFWFGDYGGNGTRGQSNLADDSLCLNDQHDSEQRAVTRGSRTFPVHRPPRAIAEEMFLETCTQCGDCIRACPHQAIVVAPEHFRAAAGTPIIDAARQACWMCPDQPCVAACQPKALNPTLPVQMGIAAIEVLTCLAYQNSHCTVCLEQCPVEGAIELHDGLPVIRQDLCTGCGVCFFVCVSPEKSILLTPAPNRPEPAP